METRSAALEAFYGGSAWKKFGSATNSTMVNSDNVLLLKPAGNLQPFRHRPPATPELASHRSCPGTIVITTCPLAPHTEADFAALFESEVCALLTRAGARIEATFDVERAANTFARLPVRDGETVFLWVSAFTDGAALNHDHETLGHNARWTSIVFPKLDERMGGRWNRCASSRQRAPDTDGRGVTPIKPYAGPLSLYSRKVEIALEEKGLSFEGVTLPFRNRPASRQNIAMCSGLNPKGQVPVMIDNDLALYDSSLILDYLS
jgi:hypothetical protein